MTNARAKSTNKAYRREFNKFKVWCGRRGRSHLPATYESVSLYLTAVAYRTKSVGMCVRAGAAIRAAHRVRGWATPTDHPSMSDLMKGIANSYGKPPTQVQPLSKALLKALLESLVSERPNALQERTAWLALLAFQMTARCGDMKRLKVKDFTFHQDGSMSVHFPLLKNIPVYKGFNVKVASQNSRWCPIRCTKKYFKHLGLRRGDSVLPVISRRVYSDADRFVISRDRVASNAALRFHFRNALRDIGVEADKFGLHSPRRGSAGALQEAGFTPDQLMSKVGWKTPAMVSLYTSGTQKSMQMSSSLAL